MKKRTGMRSWLVAGLLLAAVAAAQASPIVIFDDNAVAPWALTWHNTRVDSSVLEPHSGTHSVRRGGLTDGNGIIMTHPGITLNQMGGNTTLEFWVNHPTTDPIGSNRNVVRIDGINLEMGVRGQGVVWVVDGTPYQPTSGVVQFDSDPETWQHVTFDLTQTFYVWDAGLSQNVATTLDPDGVITQIEFARSATAGYYTPYLDDIRLIPEPASAALLLLGAAGLILGRRPRRD